ncbi:hypothetical protein AAG570_005895 [Ranatra chinensis]|uniref:Reverse transcriptase domain-containing protein n=1 Tax=Ranatra chinensis TaxID=642074 RepID=A0ABD0XY89_9HEMI
MSLSSSNYDPDSSTENGDLLKPVWKNELRGGPLSWRTCLLLFLRRKFLDRRTLWFAALLFKYCSDLTMEDLLKDAHFAAFDPPTLEELRGYLTEHEWLVMSDYEKIRLMEAIDNFRVMTDLDLNPVEPDFMKRARERKEVEGKKKSESLRRKGKAESVGSQGGGGGGQPCGRRAAKRSAESTDSVYSIGHLFYEETPCDDPTKLFTDEEDITESIRNYAKCSSAMLAVNYCLATSSNPKMKEAFEEFEKLQIAECDFCDREWLDGCPQHKLRVIQDRPVPVGPRRASRAVRTLPKELVMYTSQTVEPLGSGVWTRCTVPKGTRFGPYEGRRVDTTNHPEYSWQKPSALTWSLLWSGLCHSLLRGHSSERIALLDSQLETQFGPGATWQRWVSGARARAGAGLDPEAGPPGARSKIQQAEGPKRNTKKASGSERLAPDLRENLPATKPKVSAADGPSVSRTTEASSHLEGSNRAFKATKRGTVRKDARNFTFNEADARKIEERNKAMKERLKQIKERKATTANLLCKERTPKPPPSSSRMDATSAAHQPKKTGPKLCTQPASQRSKEGLQPKNKKNFSFDGKKAEEIHSQNKALRERLKRIKERKPPPHKQNQAETIQPQIEEEYNQPAASIPNDVISEGGVQSVTPTETAESFNNLENEKHEVALTEEVPKELASNRLAASCGDGLTTIVNSASSFFKDKEPVKDLAIGDYECGYDNEFFACDEASEIGNNSPKQVRKFRKRREFYNEIRKAAARMTEAGSSTHHVAHARKTIGVLCRFAEGRTLLEQTNSQIVGPSLHAPPASQHRVKNTLDKICTRVNHVGEELERLEKWRNSNRETVFLAKNELMKWFKEACIPGLSFRRDAQTSQAFNASGNPPRNRNSSHPGNDSCSVDDNTQVKTLSEQSQLQIDGPKLRAPPASERREEKELPDSNGNDWSSYKLDKLYAKVNRVGEDLDTLIQQWGTEVKTLSEQSQSQIDGPKLRAPPASERREEKELPDSNGNDWSSYKLDKLYAKVNRVGEDLDTLIQQWGSEVKTLSEQSQSQIDGPKLRAPPASERREEKELPDSNGNDWSSYKLDKLYAKVNRVGEDLDTLIQQWGTEAGYHQIRRHPGDIKKTAFQFERGKYEFLRGPFGLKMAPTTFQQLMDEFLEGLDLYAIQIYMYDIIVFSNSAEEHGAHMENFSRGLGNSA